MPLIDNIKWDEITDVTSAAVSGFDARTALVQRLVQEDGNLVYGFCGLDYLPEWHADHWHHLTVDHFGSKSLKQFNESVALRMNISPDATGKLMYRKEYIMYKSRSLAEKQQKYREDFAERHHDTMKQETSRAVERPYSTETPGIDSALEEKQMPASKFSGG